MGLSRRTFLAGLGAGALSGSLPAIGLGRAAVALAGPASPAAFDLASATADTFGPYVGTRFRLQRPGRALDLVLDDVVAAPRSGPTESFALVLSASKPPALAQSTYTLDHADLGRFDLFLVPSGPRAMTAVVNHLQREQG